MNERARSTAPSQPDGLPYAAELTWGDVLERIRECDDRLAELVEEFVALADKAAEDEAAWKHHLATVIMQVTATGKKTASDVRESTARTTGDGELLYLNYKLGERRCDAMKAAMRATEARLSALQTVARGIERVA